MYNNLLQILSQSQSQYLLLIIFIWIGSTGTSVVGKELSQNEKTELKKLRLIVKDSIVQDYQNTDKYLMQWLRAKNMDAVAAGDKFLEAMEWRKVNDIDSIENETMSQFKTLPYSLSGFDYEGNPILVFFPARMDIRRHLLQGHRDNIRRMTWQMMERTAIKRRVSSVKTGKDIGGSVTILDFSGFNIRQHLCLSCLSVYTDWMSALEKYYPAVIKHFVMINVPQIAIPIVDLIRPLMSPITEKVFKVFPSDKKVWSKYLLQIAAADQLPSTVGGSQQTS